MHGETIKKLKISFSVSICDTFYQQDTEDIAVHNTPYIFSFFFFFFFCFFL